ncbi:protein FAM162B isoform X1 [Oreochromis niloticus]|uniref:protein FAM162B isoform X1 n=1 Tax=Oreochromis niloticus TaxID=8128 RepID=UPI0009048D70|nr:protein FAM162B isoform X1 [Oreochromis niloticus]
MSFRHGATEGCAINCRLPKRRPHLQHQHMVGFEQQISCPPLCLICTTPKKPRPAFRVPGYRPSDMDKKMLIWSGRFKSADQIPETVSFEMIDAARNKIRVKAAYVMMAATIGACMIMVFMGKRALARNETLTALNIEKKARWREELKKPSDSAVALSDKAQ